MLKQMENQGSSRRGFSLSLRPPRLFAKNKRRGKRGEEAPVFEPYEENLPLESGFYTFVLDREGRFRVKRGNISSHASMVGGEEIGAAGRFRINRAGNVAEVFCVSDDYGIAIRRADHPTVRYVLDSFLNHHALEVSPEAIFQFASGLAESFHVSNEGRAIDDLDARRAALDREGQDSGALAPFGARERRTFSAYSPTAPPRLYGMHRDQLVVSLESDEPDAFEFGPPLPRYSPDSARLNGGKKAFVIDRSGWLIAGSIGHHLLSGGEAVGAAGQLVLDRAGVAREINLNFSGHYRPPLDAEYARYTYRSLRSHPLLSIAGDCRISGRKFDPENVLSTVLRFSEDELLSDESDLDLLIESAGW